MLAWVVCGVCLGYLLINYLLVTWHERAAVLEAAFSWPDDEEHFNVSLANLLKPRSRGSLGHAQVRDFLIQELRELGFIINRDEFFDGAIFTNVLGIMNLEAPNYLVLTCHYDIKHMPELKNFVAATDAAVSCAILLNMAKVLAPYLRGDFTKRLDIGLILVFFDGHESIDTNADDSGGLHGSRRFTEVETMPLESIELVITLNLIGAPGQTYWSHYERTYKLHEQLADIESKLHSSGHLNKNKQLFHNLKDHEIDAEDDHYPFLDEGVPVMHIVPQEFPEVLYTDDDNIENLHWPTIRNMNSIIRKFVYEYLKQHDEYTTFRDNYAFI